MIVALIAFTHIGIVLWLLWRLDRSYSRKEPPQLGWFAFRDTPEPPRKEDRRTRA